MPKQEYPKELTVGGIPLVIMNRHNEVFPYFMRLKNAVLLHFDAHPDFVDSPRVYRSEEQSMEDYVSSLTIIQFVCAAAHAGSVSVFYHIDPRNQDKHWSVGVLESGKIVDPIRTYEANAEDGVRRCYFSPHHRRENLSVEDIITDLEGYSGALILDTEVDAFYDHLDYIRAFRKGLPEDRNIAVGTLRTLPWVEKGIEYYQNFVPRIPKPNLITLVRAQEESSEPYLPLSLADELQDKCLAILTENYGEIKS